MFFWKDPSSSIFVLLFLFFINKIGAITRCRTDAELTKKLMDTLRVMESLQRESENPDNALVKPNTMTYCMAIDGFGISAYQKAFSVKKRRKSSDVKNINANRNTNTNTIPPSETVANKDDEFIIYIRNRPFQRN